MKNTWNLVWLDGASLYRRFFEPILNLLLPGTQTHYETPNSKSKMDVCIYSVYGTTNQNYPKCFRILLSGEPYDLSQRKCHILVDTKDVSHLRPNRMQFLYIPFYVMSFAERYRNVPQDLIKVKNKQILVTKSKFCAFLYNHSVPFRENLYEQISKYKKVDALGKNKHNMPKGHSPDRWYYQKGKETYFDKAVEQYQPYKFVICCENNIQYGYITEKIVNAMLAGSIPIYLGAPEITQHFNPASFINVSTFKTTQELVNYVQQLDQNDLLYSQMQMEPWFKDNKLSHYFGIENHFNALQVVTNSFFKEKIVHNSA